MDFDITNPRWVPMDDARRLIQDAWLGQFRYGDGLNIGTAIAHRTMGIHSHTGVFCRRGDQVELLELLQWHDGRAYPLEGFRRRPGIVDVFSPCRDGIYKDVFDPDGCVAVMRRLIECKYGWRGVIRVALRLFPLVWRLFPVDTRDVCGNEYPTRPFCSHAAAVAYQMGGKVDPVLRLPPYYVTPNHLTWSLFFDYEFTLLTPWVIDHGFWPTDGACRRRGSWIMRGLRAIRNWYCC